MGSLNPVLGFWEETRIAGPSKFSKELLNWEVMVLISSSERWAVWPAAEVGKSTAGLGSGSKYGLVSIV